MGRLTRAQGSDLVPAVRTPDATRGRHVARALLLCPTFRVRRMSGPGAMPRAGQVRFPLPEDCRPRTGGNHRTAYSASCLLRTPYGNIAALSVRRTQKRLTRGNTVGNRAHRSRGRRPEHGAAL